MTEEVKEVPSGATQDNVSDVTEPTSTDPEVKPSGPDSVAYETHRKLLAEKKKVQAERDELNKKIQDIEAKKLEESGKWKEAYENTKTQLAEAEDKIKSWETRILDSTKLSTFLEKVGGQVDKKYYGLIDIDKILTDPETGEIDQLSVTNLVNTFKQQFPEIIVNPNKARTPSDSPQHDLPGTISIEEFRKLSSKDQGKYKPDQIIFN